MAMRPQVIFQDAPNVRRIPRRPQHPFQLTHRVFEITPFFIAPVLPGETMKNLLLQSRVVTDPVADPLSGWWAEYYFFYVKLTDLDDRTELQEMMIQPGRNMSDIQDTTANNNHMLGTTTQNTGYQLDYVGKCLKRVVEEYFRNENEQWNIDLDSGAGGNDLPVCQAILRQDLLDSFLLDTDFITHDVNLDVDGDATITAQEAVTAMAQWEALRAGNLTDMTYEDYLRSYGVRKPLAEQNHVPELIRYVKEWTYPASTVLPVASASPTVNTQVVFSITERADKDRYFSEPGFLFGVTVARPKVYLGNQKTTLTAFMDNAFVWLPKVTTGSRELSMKKFDGTATTLGAADGPFDNITDDYWLDMKDLFLYGEQFDNKATVSSLVDLPEADGTRRYPVAADETGLFATTAKEINQDGVVTLNILGSQYDTTPTTSIATPPE